MTRLAYRLTVWMLPPHRKSWAQEMFNEVTYISTRRAAWQWIIGCTLTAFSERMTYEAGRTFVNRRILKAVLVLGVTLVVGALSIYAASKPYQRERIWITLSHALHSDQES